MQKLYALRINGKVYTDYTIVVKWLKIMPLQMLQQLEMVLL